MLLKNGKEWNLFDEKNPEAVELLKEFKKALPQFSESEPVVVKYAKRLVKASRDNPGKEDKPASITVPFRQVIPEPGKGNNVWIYCEHYDLHDSGVIKTRNPWSYVLVAEDRISWRDVEKAFFLWLSPKCANGRNPEPNGGPYVFEDKEREAAQRIEIDKLVAKCQFLILNSKSEGGLSDEEISKYAASYGVKPSAGKLEKRQLLFERVRGNGDPRNFAEFIHLTENRDKADFNESVQKAVQLGVLELRGMQIQKGTGFNQQWVLKDRDGKVVNSFGHHKKIGPQTDSVAPLRQALEQSPELRKQLTDMLEVAEALSA